MRCALIAAVLATVSAVAIADETPDYPVAERGYYFEGFTACEGYCFVIAETITSNRRNEPKTFKVHRLREGAEFAPAYQHWSRTIEHVVYAVKDKLPENEITAAWLAKADALQTPFSFVSRVRVESHDIRKQTVTYKLEIVKSGDTATLRLTPVKAVNLNKDGKELSTKTFAQGDKPEQRPFEIPGDQGMGTNPGGLGFGTLGLVVLAMLGLAGLGGFAIGRRLGGHERT